MGAIGSFINPPEIETDTKLATNRFQAQAAQAGNGADQIALQNYGDIIAQAMAQQAGVNANQNALVQSLQAQAAGTGGPNLAQQQLQNATNQNIQQQAGAVASLRGLNPAMAQRLIAGQAANIQQQLAGQSAEARMQQQLAAQGQLGALLGQQQQGNLAQLGTGAQALGQQNATTLQNQQNAQEINAQVASQNTATKLASQQANLGLVDAGAKALGGVASAAGTAAAGMGKAHGGLITGREMVPGDDPRNDTVPALLSPGEVVVPKSIADDPEATAAFVAAIKSHRKKHAGGK
jgi:hypothetical protein